MRHRRAVRLLLAVSMLFAMASAMPARAGEPVPQVLVFEIRGASFEELLAVPEVQAIARLGGAGLLSHAEGLQRQVGDPTARAGMPGLRLSVFDLGTVPDASSSVRAEFLAGVGEKVRAEVVGRTPPGGSPGYPYFQVWVVGLAPSAAMIAAKDQVEPVVYGYAAASDFVASSGPMRSLTSDSTRRDGVVAGEDFLATVAQRSRLDWTAPAGGSPIAFVEAPPPFELHARYLAMRRMTVPIGIAGGIYVTLAGLLGSAMLIVRRRLPVWVRSLGGAIALSAVPLPLALVLAGHLPTLSYASVLAFAVGSTLAATVAAVLIARRWGVATALTWMGWGVLALFLVEALLRWSAALTPLLGGSELDGGRFYGMPNVCIGLLLGACLYVAFRWERPAAGTALLAAAGLFAGLPFAGANLGGAITLFAGAGLWFAIRSGEGHMRFRGLAVAAGITVAGTLLVLLGNRFLPGPATHITRFVEGEGGGLWGTFTHRLSTGLHLIGADPFALVPVLGVPAVLAVVLWPPAPVQASFDAVPGWRDALVVILLASIVAYVANDSGAAALGLGFGTALSGLLFVSLRDRPGMIGAS